jgi:hypothetical protein
VGGFEGLPQGMGLVVAPLFGFGKSDGEGADDAAGRVVGRVLLLSSEVFDASADVGAPVAEVEADRVRRIAQAVLHPAAS